MKIYEKNIKSIFLIFDFIFYLNTFYLSNPCSVAHDMGDNGCLLVSPALFNVTGMKAYRGLRTRKDAIKYCGNIKKTNCTRRFAHGK